MPRRIGEHLEEDRVTEINDAAEYINKRCAPECLFLFGYAQRADLEGLPVLVVDDNRDAADSLGMLLRMTSLPLR